MANDGLLEIWCLEDIVVSGSYLKLERSEVSLAKSCRSLDFGG